MYRFLRFTALSLCLSLLILLLPACQDSKDDLSDKNYAVFQIQDYGKVEIELYPDMAPKTVANFKKLIHEGFYDGLTFHRIVSDFVIQGGDPEGTGYGGSDDTIPGEFSAAGFVDNTLSHTRGVVSMARSQEYDSASSQFFIVLSDKYTSSLDGLYAGFGKVIAGMEIIDSIVEDYTYGRLTQNAVIQSAILSKTASVVSSDSEGKEDSPSETTSEDDDSFDLSSELLSLNIAELTIRNYGKVEIELYPDIAPKTVANFKKLVHEGFYDGLTFHRIVPGFVLQGGDPEGTGYGGSDENIPGEFSAAGFENNLSHTRGVISMARAQEYDSASSQFFIVLSDSYTSSLDGLYAGFGKVIAGMDFVDAIVSDYQSGNLETAPIIESAVLKNAS